MVKLNELITTGTRIADIVLKSVCRALPSSSPRAVLKDLGS